MTEYELSNELTAAIEDMINDEEKICLEPLRQQEMQTKIFSLLCVRQDANGEALPCKGPPIVCRKIPAQYQALVNGLYLVVANHNFWTHANLVQQGAALLHALSSIDISTDAKGKIQFKRKPFDIMEYLSVVEHYGAWNTGLISFRDAFKQSATRFVKTQQVVAQT